MKLEVCSISSKKSLSKPYVLIGTKSVSKDQIMDADSNQFNLKDNPEWILIVYLN